MPQRRLITLFKESLPKLRPYLVTLQIVAISITPLINPEFTTFRISLTIALQVSVIYLFFDIYKELVSRLSAIEKHLKEPEPPTYSDFMEAEKAIKETIITRLDANEDVTISILGITAQYSWKFLEDHAEKFLERGNQLQKITIDLAVTKPEILELWLQERLVADADRTLKGIKYFKKKHDKQITLKRLILNVYKYDNIPHWHGVLINEDVLFLGRTRWGFIGESAELTVGQNTYRKFVKNDRFRGTDRILMFGNWLKRYRLRNKELENEPATM